MKIYNSLSKKLEEFKPINKDKVTIYVCGITPYDTTHLGHAFTYILFDTLIRFLLFKGYKVTYTQNVTDINDRDKDILEKAKEQKVSWQNLSKYWTKRFLEDMENLNWIKPQYYLNASEQIPSIIQIIKALLKKELAYEINGSVYLNITKALNFGKLSRLNKKQMIKTAQSFEEYLGDPQKHNSLDFTLWRATKPNQPPHIPSFESPWGKGRPGWHIECSAMSISTLGEQIDIHGGGKDLIFPHHEAEIVQSEGATGKIPFVKYWIHTGKVYYQKEKMSKSKGNLVMVSELLKKYSANAIRWLLLSQHYRSDWEYKEKDLKKAQKKVEHLEKKLNKQKDQPKKDLTNQLIKILDKDLNTPKALQLLLKEPNLNLYKSLGFKI